jgi:O-antigen ligase
VILVVADGLPNWARLTLVLKALVVCGSVMAVIGLLQSIAKLDLTQYVVIPGLQMKGWVPAQDTRGVAARVASTTMHYIEFSAVMAMVLPLGIHLARFSPDRRQRRRYAVLAVLIAAAVPMAISRTGIVALVVELAVMFVVWSWRFRYNMIVTAGFLLAGFAVIKPGLIGTIRNLFTNAGEDSSVTARTERYALVGHYFAQRPWLGRGTGTWIPPQYQILDNQWLALALSGGIVGVVALATLHIMASTLAVIAWRRAVTEEDRHLCAALLSSQVVAILVGYFFDSLSFTTYATVLSVMVGLCGAAWRFTHPSRTIRTSTTRWYDAS